MAHLRKAGAILRGSLIQKLSQQWNGSNILSPAPAALCILSRGMACSKLFVGGLSWTADEGTLREAFSSYGNLTEVKIITDRDTGRSRGFGFVCFTSDAEAESALKAMDGQSLTGRVIRVNYANIPGRGPRAGGMPPNLGLGAGRGSYGTSFGSAGGFGGDSARLGMEKESSSLKGGGFANEGGGFGNNAGFGNEDGRFGSKGGISKHEQGSLGFENFANNGRSLNFQESGDSINSGSVGLQAGSLGTSFESTEGFGRDVAHVGINTKMIAPGGFANKGGGFGNYAGFGNQDGSFGGRVGVSQQEQGSLGVENFAIKERSLDFRESGHSRHSGSFGFPGGGLGTSFGSTGGFGRDSVHAGNETERFGPRGGAFANEGEGTGNHAAFGNEDESFGGKGGFSKPEQGSLGFQNFGSKEQEMDSRGFGHSRISGRFELQGGGLGQNSGGLNYVGSDYGQRFGAFEHDNRIPGRYSEGIRTRVNDFASEAGGGFGGSPNLGPESRHSNAPWSCQHGEYANPNLVANASGSFGTDGWRGADCASINDREGFLRSSENFEKDGNFNSAAWTGSSSAPSRLASSGDWRSTGSENFNASSANWRGFSNDIPNDMPRQSFDSLHDESKPSDRQNSSPSDSWRAAEYAPNSHSGWRNS